MNESNDTPKEETPVSFGSLDLAALIEFVGGGVQEGTHRRRTYTHSVEADPTKVAVGRDVDAVKVQPGKS